MNFPQKVTIVEVGPRDGFQNEGIFIPTDKKIDIVNALAKTGLKNIQVTSAVHPKAIPQLADAEEVMTKMERLPGVSYRILAPNLKGGAKIDPPQTGYDQPDDVHQRIPQPIQCQPLHRGIFERL